MYLVVEIVHFSHLMQQRYRCIEFIIVQIWMLFLNVIYVHIMSAQKCMYLYNAIIIKFIIFLEDIYLFYLYRELLDHVRLHGEELAVVHQQNMEYDFPTKSKAHRTSTDNSKLNKFFLTLI